MKPLIWGNLNKLDKQEDIEALRHLAYMTLGMSDTQHNNTAILLSAIMLSVVFFL
jgi:hypothetical protein